MSWRNGGLMMLKCIKAFFVALLMIVGGMLSLAFFLVGITPD